VLASAEPAQPLRAGGSSGCDSPAPFCDDARDAEHAWVGLLVVVLSGCTSSPARPARSSVGCAQAVVDQHLPAHLSDKLAHCMAER
jgi:hypothetical protein